MSSLYNAIDSGNKGGDLDERKLTISVGRVVDTNDPMQMGRIRVFVAGLDSTTNTVRDIPFAIYCSPFAGHQQVQSRGPEDGVYTTGPVAYGMFAIPKVGTDVLIAHLNGDPTFRIWFGALFGPLLTETLPHGRYMFNSPVGNSPSDLDGPLSSAEQPIQPIYDNQTAAYTRTSAIASNDTAIQTTPRKNFEWRVRGADFQGSGLGNIQRNLPDQKVSKVTDDRNYDFTEEDGSGFHQGNFTQGYALSRIQPNAKYDPDLVDGGQNLDPQTYSWTTPGFSSIAMDDRPENARIRLRTGTGHQIILDDTNERIYISTVQGNNWIEMDQNGNVDIYSARRVSIHAAMDVNITTDQTFRVYAAKGIHMTSGGEFRVTAANDMSLRGGGNADLKIDKNINIQSNNDTNINSGANLNLESANDTNINSGANLNLQSAVDTNISTAATAAWTVDGSLNIGSSNNIIIAGKLVEVNTSTPAVAASAGEAALPAGHEAYFTNRVPEHEPWGRIMMAQSATDNNTGNKFTLQLSYNSADVGKVELTDTIIRNSRWHR